MDFINTFDLWQAILSNRRKLPRDIDLVVGIPRSGMLPATMIATQLNLPVTDLDGLVENRIFGHGTTKSAPDLSRANASDRTVLVIDDTVGSGQAFKRARAALAGVSGRLVFCAVFAPVARHPDVDIVLEKAGPAPICQWNMMHHAVLQAACVDIDGVLCRKPEPHEDDNGRNYRKFIATAEKLFATSGEIRWLVTSRPERYRAATEEWLSKNGVRYRDLIMPSTDESRHSSTEYKARIYKSLDAKLFVESEADDAARISELSGRPVLCIATQSLIVGDSRPMERLRREVPPLGSHLGTLKLSARRILGDSFYYAVKRMLTRV